MSIFWLIEALAGLTENYIGFLLIGDVLGAEKKKYVGTGFFSLLLTAGLLLLNHIRLLSSFAVMYGIVGMTFCAYLLYRKNPGDIIVSVGSFFLLIYALDFFLILVLGTLTRNYNYGAEITGSHSWARVLFIIIAKTGLILTYFLFHICSKKIPLSFRKTLPAVLVAVWLAFCLVRRICIGISMDVAGTGILFFLVVAMGIYLMMQYSEMKAQKMQAEMNEERSRVMMNGYQEMMKHYNNSLTYYHDLKNHMITMEGYLLNEKYEKAAEYVRSLRNSYGGTDSRIWTGIEIIDFILSFKKASAEEKNISFRIDADPVAVRDITETDLCALLGNVLDNAIEGCERVEGEKEICVSIRNVQEMFMIKVVNTCNEMIPEQDEGAFPATVKKERSLHGWGMRSMDMIMKKYGGTMQYGYREGRFSMVLTFFL